MFDVAAAAQIDTEFGLLFHPIDFGLVAELGLELDFEPGHL